MNMTMRAADAAEQLLGHPVHFGARIRSVTGERVAGPAVTLRVARAAGASAAEAGMAVARALESASVGSVVVVCVAGGGDAATVGGVFAAVAKARGLAGFVVDGYVRDVTVLNGLAVPVFARGAVAGPAGGGYRLDAVNGVVSCAGREVHPGDFIIADSDGVVAIPHEMKDAVLTRAAELHAEETALIDAILQHGSLTAALRAAGRR